MDLTIKQIIKEIDYASNPYFVHLKDGTFTQQDFVETQSQFYFAVEFFARPMAALVSKIPCAERRLGILRNVWEEHGEGNRERFHKHTFLTFLHRLAGCAPESVNAQIQWPEVRIFNTTLEGICNSDNYLLGAATLGIIELMFSDISSLIGRGVVDRGWLKSDLLIHYNLHEQLDIQHSADFFDVLRVDWVKNLRAQETIEQGLRLGASLFNGLYEGLYRARKRRNTPKVSHDHTLPMMLVEELN